MLRTTILTAFTAGLFMLGYPAILQAQQIVPGTYQMNDGKVIAIMTIMTGANNGKYLFDGSVKTASGAECMMNGPATLNGNELEIGYKCSVRLTASESEIVIDDYKKCIPCDPGAYVSGIYKKQ